MKKTSIFLILQLCVAFLLIFLAVPAGFRLAETWTNFATFIIAATLILGPIALTFRSVYRLYRFCSHAGRPIPEANLPHGVPYIVEGAFVEGAKETLVCFAVLRRANLKMGDDVTDRLFVFFPGRELRPGNRVMGVSSKWYGIYMRAGASANTTLVTV